MAQEVVSNFKYPLKILVTPFATEMSSDRLYYDVRQDRYKQPYYSVLPERIIANMVTYSHTLVEHSAGDTVAIEDRVIDHFLNRCGEEQAIKVAASIIHHQSGAWGPRLDEVQKIHQLPFNMDQDFQRRLFKRSAQFEYDNLQKDLKQQLKQHATWDGIPKMRAKLESLKKLLNQIDEREGGSVIAGQLL